MILTRLLARKDFSKTLDFISWRFTLSDDINTLLTSVDELNTPAPEVVEEKVPESAMSDLEPDEQIFAGGPTRAEIEAFKKQFPHSQVMATLLADSTGIVWRTFNRLEWKQIQALTRQIADPDKKEEIIFSKIVLFPNCSDQSSVLNLPAGAVTSVMNEFYLYSGFQPVTESLKL